jgi:hypothetical protein
MTAPLWRGNPDLTKYYKPGLLRPECLQTPRNLAGKNNSYITDEQIMNFCLTSSV